jgi:hypothetical protein
MSSIIRLDILTLPSINDYVEFQSGETPGMRETFVTTRTQFGQCNIGSWAGGTLDDKLNSQLGALVGALQADYSTNLEVRLDLNVPPGVLPHITVKSNIYNYFTEDKWVDNGSNWQVAFTNVPTVQPITVDSFVFVEANPGVPCTQVNAIVTASEQPDSYGFSPTGTFFPVTTNPFTVPTLNRATSYFLYVKKGCSGASTAPTIQTNSLSNATSTSVTSGGNSITDGGDSVTSKGVELSYVSDFSTIFQTQLDGTGGTAGFSVGFTGLTPGVTFYTRAFATNSVGTGYGSIVQDLPRPNLITSTYLASESQACAVTSWDTNCFTLDNEWDLDGYVYLNSGLTQVFAGQSTSNPATTVYYSVKQYNGTKLAVQIDSNGQLIDYPALCP